MSSTITISLVGFQYHCSQDYIDLVNEGYRLLLKRDESNTHDPMAIGAYDGKKLVAYVKKEIAHKIWEALAMPMWCTITEDCGNYKRAELSFEHDESKDDDTYSAPWESVDITPYTEENLHALATTIREIFHFKNKLLETDETREMLESCLHCSDEEATLPLMLKVVIAADICVIYKKLGHTMGLQEPEELAFYMYCWMLNDEKEKFKFDFGWRFYMKNMKESVDNIRSMAEGLFPVPCPEEYVLYLQALLFNNLDDEQYATRYMVLMYRLASLIAKADGTITQTEADWLAKMMEKPVFDDDDEESTKDEEPAKVEEPSNKAMDELMSLVGLTEVKEEISRLRSFIQIQNRRREDNLPIIPVSRHFVFTGNPGTGKTTVARILAQIYHDLGVVKRGHLVETDRSGLVGEYVGQTAIKTNKIIDSALDGVLFIDEAYALAGGAKEDYGSEAISTLLKRMEDDRDRLIVILAGYDDQMQQFIDSNPGLQSRFNRYIHFPDYSAEELCTIFQMQLKKNDFVLSSEAEEYLHSKMQEISDSRTKNFGNARFVRNMFEKTLENQAVRLSAKPSITHNDLITIEQEDL